MNTQQLKQEWQSARQSIRVTGDSTPDLTQKTYLQKLANKYKFFSRFALIAALLLGILLSKEFGNPWVTALYVIFMLISSVTDFYLYRSVKSIDIDSMSVREVAMRAMKLRRLHLLFIAIMLPVAFGLVALFLYVINSDTYMIIAVCTGGLTGLIIGSMHLKEFLDAYRHLTDYKQE